MSEVEQLEHELAEVRSREAVYHQQRDQAWDERRGMMTYRDILQILREHRVEVIEHRTALDKAIEAIEALELKGEGAQDAS